MKFSKNRTSILISLEDAPGDIKSQKNWFHRFLEGSRGSTCEKKSKHPDTPMESHKTFSLKTVDRF